MAKALLVAFMLYVVGAILHAEIDAPTGRPTSAAAATRASAAAERTAHIAAVTRNGA